LLVRSRVAFLEMFTRIAESVPDATTNASSRTLTILVAKTSSCAAPSSLIVLIPAAILLPSIRHE
jgi:hypothetical protein